MPSKKKHIKIYVNDAEYTQLRAAAYELGCSMSRFGKVVLLGYKHPAKTDLQVLKEVSRFLPALKQVGGLMKHFLAQYPKDLASIEIRKQLKQIEASRTKAEALFNEVAELILGAKRP